MPLEKVYECICDNTKCGHAIYHALECTKEEAKRQLRSLGIIVKGDKCYCDQECFDTRNG